jgi:hypothetical protein
MYRHRTCLSTDDVRGLLREELAGATITKIGLLERHHRINPERSPAGHRNFCQSGAGRSSFVLRQQRECLPAREFSRDELADATSTADSIVTRTHESRVANLIPTSVGATEHPLATVPVGEAERGLAPAQGQVAALSTGVPGVPPGDTAAGRDCERALNRAQNRPRSCRNPFPWSGIDRGWRLGRYGGPL